MFNRLKDDNKTKPEKSEEKESILNELKSKIGKKELKEEFGEYLG